MILENFQKKIQIASQVIGTTWPLYSFVTSNPLSGFENKHFEKAVQEAKMKLGGNVFPETATFRKALQEGEINEKELIEQLTENNFQETPSYYLDKLDSLPEKHEQNSNAKLDRIMVKWLMAFMDEGLAEWEMPFKEDGFYSSWRILSMYDQEMKINSLADLPKTSSEVLDKILKNYTEQEQIEIMEYHLAALPGWTGYIKHREESNSNWQQKFSITLQDYLAVRLWLANHFQIQVIQSCDQNPNSDSNPKLQYHFLKAWEKSWQNKLISDLKTQKNTKSETEKVPDAQMVFCIDTRSELIRRNVESKGNYETFGYAGFFGIAMDYQNLEDGISRKSCPPIVSSAYQVSEIAQENKEHLLDRFQKRNERKKFNQYFLTRMKNMLPSAFGYVEGSGVFYGFSLLSRTLFPKSLYNPIRNNQLSHENNSEPKICHSHSNEMDTNDIPLTEKTAIVKSAFDLMGWKQFAPLVVFVGHGSHSANNPFASSLDCGACAASPGRHNARMLAKLANHPAVRNALKENHSINIPETTVFLGAEHNTTTDEIVLFDSTLPNSHTEQLLSLKKDLRNAQETATKERLGITKNSISEVHKKTNNWAETRPEWGLAKNAGFIIGPRTLTKNLNLQGHCFLHSYNWELDKNGIALEGIMQGPMVVTQWINNHYYFATVDNEKFGGGSKISHNITGKFGVVQGNGGDLKIGLPLQSVNESDEKLYHQPLRLSVLIQAPKENIQEILLKNNHLKNLLDNEWIYLLVIDPTSENNISRYQKGMEWVHTTKTEHFSENVLAEI
ncbi:MAG: DUF2309 domain-containing protein [Flavobacterium sp.]|uniref:DUF2309 domain-containing protein n=1 Tax=Flavobacterium sp. TaxID=239 RepID=UPI00326677D6